MRVGAVLLMFLVAGCGARQAGAAAGPIPWVHRPAPAYTAPPWKAPPLPRRSAPLITCSRSAVSGLGRHAPAPRPPRAAPGTPGTLHVRLSLRKLERIATGRTLRYVVTLHNPTQATVTLDPCPSYTEALYLE